MAVAVCDVCLSGRDGLWLAAEVRTRWPDTAVVMATGLQDVGSAVAGLRRGVIDYLIKPFGRDRLREALVAAVTWHRAALATRNGRDALHGEVAERQEQLKAALAALRIESRDGLEAILGMLMIRDRALLEHSQRVARLALEIGRDLGMSGDALAALELAALVHEIGRLALPDSVAGKPGPFNANDHERVRRVPTVGHELLRAVPFLARAAELVLARHERWDGTGLPARPARRSRPARQPCPRHCRHLRQHDEPDRPATPPAAIDRQLYGHSSMCRHDGYGFFGVLYSASFWNDFQTVA